MDSSTADRPTEHQPPTASSPQQNTQFNLRTANQLFLQLNGVSSEEIQFIFSNLPRMEVNSSSFVLSSLREVLNGGGHPANTGAKSFNIVALVSRVDDQVCTLTDRFASDFRLKLLTSDGLSAEAISSTFLPGNILCARGVLKSAQDGGLWCAETADCVVST